MSLISKAWQLPILHCVPVIKVLYLLPLLFQSLVSLQHEPRNDRRQSLLSHKRQPTYNLYPAKVKWLLWLPVSSNVLLRKSQGYSADATWERFLINFWHLNNKFTPPWICLCSWHPLSILKKHPYSNKCPYSTRVFHTITGAIRIQWYHLWFIFLLNSSYYSIKHHKIIKNWSSKCPNCFLLGQGGRGHNFFKQQFSLLIYIFRCVYQERNILKVFCLQNPL